MSVGRGRVRRERWSRNVRLAHGRVATSVASLCLAVACQRSTSAASVVTDSTPLPTGVPANFLFLWNQAVTGDEQDLASLAALEGAQGLVEGSESPTYRLVALRAMAFAEGWAQLPRLAAAAASGGPEAAAALDSVATLAARPRRQSDGEDAEELAAGCAALVSIAERSSQEARVAAVRALRMLPCRTHIASTDVDTR